MYTVFENISGRTRLFGYLGAQGIRLGPGEAVVIPGDLIATMPDVNMRFFRSMERDLQAKAIMVRSRPAPVLYDQLEESPCTLAIDGGALGECFPSSSSLSVTVSSSSSAAGPSSSSSSSSSSAQSMSCYQSGVSETLTLNADVGSPPWGAWATLETSNAVTVEVGNSEEGQESVFATTNPAQNYDTDGITEVTVRMDVDNVNQDNDLDIRIYAGGVWGTPQTASWLDGEDAIKTLIFNGTWSKSDFTDFRIGVTPANMSVSSDMQIDRVDAVISGEITTCVPWTPPPTPPAQSSSSSSSSSAAVSSSSSSEEAALSSSCYQAAASETLTLNQDIATPWSVAWGTLATDNGAHGTIDDDHDGQESIYGTTNPTNDYDDGSIDTVTVRVQCNCSNEDYTLNIRIYAGGGWTATQPLSWNDGEGEQTKTLTFNGAWDTSDFNDFRIGLGASSGHRNAELEIDYVNADIDGTETTCEIVNPPAMRAPVTGDELFAAFYGESSLSSEPVKDPGTLAESIQAEFNIEKAGQPPSAITEVRVDEQS